MRQQLNSRFISIQFILGALSSLLLASPRICGTCWLLFLVWLFDSLLSFKAKYQTYAIAIKKQVGFNNFERHITHIWTNKKVCNANDVVVWQGMARHDMTWCGVASMKHMHISTHENELPNLFSHTEKLIWTKKVRRKGTKMHCIESKRTKKRITSVTNHLVLLSWCGASSPHSINVYIVWTVCLLCAAKSV